MNNYKIISFVIFSLLLSSCRVLDFMVHPGDYQRRDAPKEVEIRYINEPIIIANKSGELASAGEKLPDKKFIISKIGQSFSINPGQTVEYVADNIDFSKYTFDIETDETTKEIKMILVDKDFSKVTLKSKCHTIERRGIVLAPKIEVAEGLDPEQIVITPLFDEKCNPDGYEIRYGARERGCREESQKNFENYKRCRDKKPLPNEFEKHKCQDSELCRKLGLRPCCTKQK
ncbi:MAG: hypothetical protein HW421_232 [Ignavibacteria bacterium]|nr:hypothetical protein [Ignavibacteria bacterium]